MGADPADGPRARPPYPGQRDRARPGVAQPAADREQFARQCASVPLRHGTSPEEVGRAVLAILALPSMTGQMIALDGGQHLQWAARAARPRNETDRRRRRPASGTCSCATWSCRPASASTRTSGGAQRVRINVDLGVAEEGAGRATTG